MGADFIGYDHDDDPNLVPPEQLSLEDGKIGWLVPVEKGFEIEDKQTWECLRCGHQVLRPVYEGQQPHPPEYCQSCEKGAGFKLVGPKAVIEPEWKPPADVEPAPPSEIFADVREYIDDHVNLEHDFLYDGLTVWSLETWHKEAFPCVSHLCIRAPTTSGKTRLCRTLAGVSYRGVNAGGASASPLFRSINDHDVTPFISEFTGLPRDTKKQIHNVIRSAQKKGEPILRSIRVGEQWIVKPFDTFTPMAIASQYDFPDDVKNRSIILEMHHDPGGIEPILQSAEDLTERLLFFRYSTRADVQQKFDDVVNDLYEEGIMGRLLEQLAPLVTVARVCNVDLSEFVDWQKKRHREVIREQAHVQICEILSDRIRNDKSLSISKITEEFNRRTEADWTVQKMGLRLKDLGVDRERGSSGRMEAEKLSAVEAIELHGADFGVEVPDVEKQMEL